MSLPGGRLWMTRARRRRSSCMLRAMDDSWFDADRQAAGPGLPAPARRTRSRSSRPTTCGPVHAGPCAPHAAHRLCCAAAATGVYAASQAPDDLWMRADGARPGASSETRSWWIAPPRGSTASTSCDAAPSAKRRTARGRIHFTRHPHGAPGVLRAPTRAAARTTSPRCTGSRSTTALRTASTRTTAVALRRPGGHRRLPPARRTPRADGRRDRPVQGIPRRPPAARVPRVRSATGARSRGASRRCGCTGTTRGSVAPSCSGGSTTTTARPLYRIDIALPEPCYGAEYDGEEFHTEDRTRSTISNGGVAASASAAGTSRSSRKDRRLQRGPIPCRGCAGGPCQARRNTAGGRRTADVQPTGIPARR